MSVKIRLETSDVVKEEGETLKGGKTLIRGYIMIACKNLKHHFYDFVDRQTQVDDQKSEAK